MVGDSFYATRSIYTTIMESGPKKPSPLWFLGPNSIIVVNMDPLGKEAGALHIFLAINKHTWTETTKGSPKPYKP